MRRFIAPVSLFRSSTRYLLKWNSSKLIPEFNPGNQNHLAKALAEASIRQSNPYEPKYDKEEFLKQYRQAKPILNVCSTYGLNDDSIMSAIEEHPEIMNFDCPTISSVITQLQTLGFNLSAISTIIAQYPHILQYDPNDISSTMDTFRKKHLGERFIIKLLISYPLLFSVSNETIADRLGRVNYFMQNKINRLTNLLLRNPSLLCCDWDEVEQKYRYLYHTMRVLEKDISRSQALTLPLSHIILRHTFLDRCGVFIRHGLKDDEKGFNPHKNPPLSEIVDTSDDEFARHVAKVSPSEYEVFKGLMHYANELEDEESELNLSSEFDVEEY